MIKIVLTASLITIFLLTTSGLAQDSAGAPGCGDPKVKFEVKTAKVRQSAQPEEGKALLYFIEDDSNFGSSPKPTARMGVDGDWVGATHGSSYLSVSVDPGVHHLCASWQTTVVVGMGHMTSAAHFTAEAGNVYYFVVRDIWVRDGLRDMSLGPLDSDEGQLLVNRFSLSTSHPKD
ncbi:MAG: hypothetical protein ABSD20_17810 [Terriglobales bacterium]|jgi:hypothetical protein